MMSTKAVYRALLHCYPAAFRQEYGNQMALLFAEQMDEARREGGRLRRAGLWLEAAMDALIIAPKEHGHVIVQDLRYALRTWAARPSFAAVAILSLALGIGANTAIFSLWNSVLHASLPGVQQPQGLVMLSDPGDSGRWTGRWIGRTDGPRSWLTYEEFELLRDHAPAFSAVMASQSSLDTWEVRLGGGDSEKADGRLVSGGYFQVLGVRAAIGRLFTRADDYSETPAVALSYDYWQRRFGGRRDVLGRTITFRKAAMTIIGVAQRGFFGETVGQRPDFWLSMRMQPQLREGADWLHDKPPSKTMWLNVFGRLRPGVTQAQAEAQANALLQADLETFYGSLASGERRSEYLDQRLRVQPASRGASRARKEFSLSLTALLSAVGILLLIACANLANLVLARGAARKPEIALRLSLGASRGRIVRQLVAESAALAVAGGATGLGIAYALHGALVRMMSESDEAFQMGFSLDPLVLAFAGAVTIGAALLFGALPAWQVTRTGAAANLQEQSRGGAGTPGGRWGRFLVAAQLALSLPLLVGAGLLGRTFHNLQRADLGYPAEHLALARVELREAAAEARRHGLVQELRGELLRIPGVRAVSYSQLGLFSGGDSNFEIEVEGYTPKDEADRNSGVDVTGPGYFSTLGVPMVLGRDILESDHAGAPKVCVINEAFAKRFFAGRNPIGLRVTSISHDQRASYQVAGVAKNARTQGLRKDVEPRYFLAAEQTPASYVESPFFLIRTAGESASVSKAVRESIQRISPGVRIAFIRTIEEHLAPLTAQDRINAQLAAAFGCVALALAAIGLYGVLSYGVARRTGEIAVRIALGARPRGVIAMILRETMALVVTGLAVGAGLAYAASTLIHTRLYGVAPQDPATLALAAALLVSVAIASAYLPARRASRLDPMAALRRE